MTIVYFSDATDGDCGLGGFEGPRRDRGLANRARIRKRFNLAATQLVTATPSFDGSIKWANKKLKSPADRPEAECLITRRKDIAIGIYTRDCIPVLFENKEDEIVAAAHVSRENLIGPFIENVLKAINPGNHSIVEAHMGPCLQLPNHELGQDVVDKFLKARPDAEKFFYVYPEKPDKVHFDYSNFTAHFLEQRGVQIAYQSDEDTYSDPRYFSRRRLKDKPDIHISFIGMMP